MKMAEHFPGASTHLSLKYSATLCEGDRMSVSRICMAAGSWRRSLVAVLMFWVGVVAAHASVTLLLEQPYGKMNIVNPAGHSAIYLDRVCAETPLELRMCHAGELGVVISRYNDVGGHDWLAIPLIPYLYAVNSAGEIPQSVDRDEVQQLREAYRVKSLLSVAPDDEHGAAPDDNWYELVGSAYDRTSYGFQVNTTEEQDEALVAWFNDRRNVERYNGAFRNCADFARVVLNFYYPHAVRRNYIANVGITSPKSVARSLAHYAKKHPEAGLDVFMIEQVDGSLPRSHRTQDVGEGLLKHYGLPMMVVSPTMTAAVLVAYVAHGRFTVPRDCPRLDVSTLAAAKQVKEAEVGAEMPVGRSSGYSSGHLEDDPQR
jgi:hypothetical protein